LRDRRLRQRLVTVDALPGERACSTFATDAGGARNRWPGTERDALAITDHLHWAMPVGFYYKMFVRPRRGARRKAIRRATAPAPSRGGVAKPTRFVRVDVS
jgi:hypothetical protein